MLRDVKIEPQVCKCTCLVVSTEKSYLIQERKQRADKSKTIKRAKEYEQGV